MSTATRTPHRHCITSQANHSSKELAHLGYVKGSLSGNVNIFKVKSQPVPDNLESTWQDGWSILCHQGSWKCRHTVGKTHSLFSEFQLLSLTHHDGRHCDSSGRHQTIRATWAVLTLDAFRSSSKAAHQLLGHDAARVNASEFSHTSHDSEDLVYIKSRTFLACQFSLEDAVESPNNRPKTPLLTTRQFCAP